jgi:sterol desaturase/sphingolipid hydroxylase (fatty acid hydroxylase superfamily)
MIDWAPVTQTTPMFLGWLDRIAGLFSPFGTDSRLHWTGLFAFVLLGLCVFLAERRRSPGERSGFIAFLFPAALYRTPSTWVDIKVYLAGRIVKPAIKLVAVPLGATVMAATAGLTAGIWGSAQANSSGPVAVVIASLLVAIVNDFSYYVTHRLSHESPLFWPFHKLHHSAEVLTPITAKRNHPVFDLLLALVGIVMTAPVAGIFLGLLGVTGFATIFGLSVLIALMNVTGGALRHSHVWLDFGPVMARILISPAQHQIHHSIAPEHQDRNYGLVLAVWDWMFGTLYVPERRERLTFGVADRDGTPHPQVHNTLRQAYLVPFAEVAEIARSHRAKPPAGEHA